MMLSTINRTRCAVGTMTVWWRTLSVRAGNQRGLCSKPQEEGIKPVAPAHTTFRVPGHRPSDFDKKMLIWAGRFKTPEQIPELVSMEMIDAARNKVRVKVCYAMVLATILGCVGMVILGKRAAARHESLTSWNMEKKARWKDEGQHGPEDVALKGEKAQ